jgi:hypothetical protein
MPQLTAAVYAHHIANARQLRADAFGNAVARIVALFRDVPEQVVPAALAKPCERTVIS